MEHFPLYTRLTDRPCLVIGSGRMIQEKAELLSRAGAAVSLSDRFEEESARRAFLIIADVGDEEAERLKKFCESHRVLLNVVDKPRFCSFIVPAILEQGDLLLSVSTSGKSPALAGWIRRRLQNSFGTEYARLLQVLGQTREWVRERLPAYGDRKIFYYQLFDRGLPERARGLSGRCIQRELTHQLKDFMQWKASTREKEESL